jgi:hypothetical protein
VAVFRKLHSLINQPQINIKGAKVNMIIDDEEIKDGEESQNESNQDFED